MSKKSTHVAAIVEDGNVLEWIKHRDKAEDIERLTRYNVVWVENMGGR